MKIFNKFTYALMALSMVAVSCVQEETFKPGEKDDANCYGVYFPKQDASGFHEWDPADPSEIVVKVSRKVTTDAISVPVDVVTSDSIWVCPKTIEFEEGQTDTSIVITFEEAVLGKKYDGVTIEINDPKYASKYSSDASFFNFSTQKVKWNSLGTTKFTDMINTALFSCPNYETEVEVQERDDMPGMYRLIEPFKGYSKWINEWCLAEEGELWSSSDEYVKTHIIIDATDPEAVWIPAQSIGYSHDPGYGFMWFGTKYAVYLEVGYTPEKAAAAGVLPDGKNVNGVITFPAKTVCVWMPTYDSLDNGWWTGDFKLVLPGAREVDYSLSGSAAETDADGKSVITLEAGADVASASFKVYEGTLSNSQYGDQVALISKDTLSATFENVKFEDGVAVIEYSDDTTGVFTLVAVGRDSLGYAQSDTRVEFGYVKAGDEIPVAASFNAVSIPGYTEDNEVVVNVFGKDITDVKITHVEYAAMMASQEAYDQAIASVYTAESLDADAIEAVNGSGYTAKKNGLLPGTRYVFMAYVFNGFKSDVLFADVTTSGEPKKIYQTWDEPDEDLMAAAAAKGAEAFYGTYNYYARRSGYYGDGDNDKYNDILRQPIGKVKIEDSGIPKEGPDEDGLYDEYVMVTGLFSPFVEYSGITDTLIFDVYDGIMYDLMQPVGVAFGSFYATAMPYESTYGPQKWNYSYVGAYAEEGYISFFNNSNYECDGFGVVAFKDEEMTSSAGILCSMRDVLLVDPAVDEETPAAAASLRRPSGTTKGRMFDLCPNYTRLNCVETDKGLKKSNIDRIKAQRRNPVLKADFTPVNDVIVPAVMASGKVTVVSPSHVEEAGAHFTRLEISAPKVRR